MNIDERLERLVQRHEVLTESLELLGIDIRDLRTTVSALTRAAQQDGENIRALARIAEIRERRLRGGEQQG